jgi:hypothetical protein
VRNVDVPLYGIGITLSALQVQLAREQARKLRVQEHCLFLKADYLQLPLLDPVGLIFSIEAFVHASDVSRFFEQATTVLKAGGRLILCDDFLTKMGTSTTLSSQHTRWVQEFQRGWHTPGLLSIQQTVQIARKQDLSLISDRDLTPFLELQRPRDRLIAVLIALGRHFPLHWPYWSSLVGGHALQQCLLSGLIEYHILVFEKTSERYSRQFHPRAKGSRALAASLISLQNGESSVGTRNK